nr:hypothetical protein CFP56_33124 [Quercus suber]
MKVGCQLGMAREEEATSVPPGAAGWVPLTGSRITIRKGGEESWQAPRLWFWSGDRPDAISFSAGQKEEE